MYRGSSTSHARAYKKAGHVNEEDFGSLVGGSNIGLPPQGKTDWIDGSRRTYSVKRGHGCKKWQVFLYGRERISNDKDFLRIGNVGPLLLEALGCFPDSYAKYSEDKNSLKKFLTNIIADDRSGISILSRVVEQFEGKNTYLDSKISLSRITAQICKELSNPGTRKDFFQKSMFNNTEVSHLALSQEKHFEIYSRELVVSALGEGLEPSASKPGTNKLDLNVPGQKVLLKNTSNVVEIEIRNDSEKHYRQVRFNMVTAPAIALLKERSVPDKDRVDKGIVWMIQRH
jgi:hypothetical protein